MREMRGWLPSTPATARSSPWWAAPPTTPRRSTDTQQLAEEIVAQHVATLARQDARNAGLVALDPRNGEIVAMVGSPSYYTAAIDGHSAVSRGDRRPARGDARPPGCAKCGAGCPRPPQRRDRRHGGQPLLLHRGDRRTLSS